MTNLNIILFGATGLCGQQIVQQSLNGSYSKQVAINLTAYQRQPSQPNMATHTVIGNLTDEIAIAQAIQGMDVIISAVGNRNYEDSTLVVTPLVKLICRHIQPHQRFIVVAGSGLTLANFSTLRRDLAGQPPFLANQRADHWEAYCHLAPLDIDYLVICPTMMVAGVANGNYVFAEKYFPTTESKQVLAGNVADFIVKEIVEKQYHQTRIGIADK